MPATLAAAQAPCGVQVLAVQAPLARASPRLPRQAVAQRSLRSTAAAGGARLSRPTTAAAAPPPSPAATAGLLARLFGGGGGRDAGVRQARRRLVEELSGSKPDAAAMGGAVDALIAARVPFREADLGGGPHSVVYTRGPLLWQLRASSSGRVASPGGNQASQDFDPRTRTVVNRGELLGSRVALTAGGSYAPVDASPGSSSSSGGGGRGRCPQLVRASIEGGAVEAWGGRLNLPIKGEGLVEVAYVDASGLRIFRSTNGSLSVQISDAALAAGVLGERWQRRQAW